MRPSCVRRRCACRGTAPPRRRRAAPTASSGVPACTIAAGPHHRHAVAERERLADVVGDVERPSGRARRTASRRSSTQPLAQRAGRARRAARRAAARAAPARARGRARRAAARRPRASATARCSRPASPTSSSSSRDPASRSRARPDPAMRRPKRDVAGDVAMREEHVVLEHQADPAPVRRDAVEVAAVERDRARRRASGDRRSTRSSVVLPQPLGPSSASVSPRATSRSTPASAAVPSTRHRDAVDAQHQSAIRAPSAAVGSRSAARTAAAVDRHRARPQSAAAAPWFSAPGRPRKRKIATGSVGWSLRARKTVAPNSPSAIANARPGRDAERPRASGRSTSRRRAAGDAPSVAAASRSRGSIARSAGATMPDDERRGDERLRDRDEPAATPRKSSGAVSKRDQEAEAEHHGGGAERQHHERRRASPAGRRASADRREPADHERDRRRDAAASASELKTACQGATSSDGVSSPSAR